jgi:hypothetical protein
MLEVLGEGFGEDLLSRRTSPILLLNSLEAHRQFPAAPLSMQVAAPL